MRGRVFAVPGAVMPAETEARAGSAVSLDADGSRRRGKAGEQNERGDAGEAQARDRSETLRSLVHDPVPLSAWAIPTPRTLQPAGKALMSLA